MDAMKALPMLVALILVAGCAGNPKPIIDIRGVDRDQYVLLLNSHHIISDGWSRAVFNRELSAFYNAAVKHVECPLPPLRLPSSRQAARQPP